MKTTMKMKTAWWFQTYIYIYIISMSYMDMWDVILPIDELIFVKMVIAPPTRKLASGNLT